MRLIWHHNEWPWGRTATIVTSDGMATVEMSFENNNPGVCYLSGLSVAEPMRKKGLGKHLMLACESYCREHGIFRIDLNAVMEDWLIGFYEKCGYKQIKELDGFMQMYKILTPKRERDIDEAAEAYGREQYAKKGGMFLSERCRGCYAPIVKAFKAGAELRSADTNWKPAEWSEEDEKVYDKARDAIYYQDCNDKDDVLFALKDLCELVSRMRKVLNPRKEEYK